jgi:threonylcarbamoyladenosine tRNA methylthiotransferase MtaB
LTSLDPADISDDLINFVADSETICPQFHVALQSGDGEVLKRMRRRYKPKQFLYCTDLIRRMTPDAAIGTDVMVGFPGETDEEFQNSFNLLKESAVTYFHVFSYSKRKNTPAATMPNQIHPRLIKERSRILRELGHEKKSGFYRSFIGRTLPVLVERGEKGTTPNYISVRIENGGFRIGDEVQVEIRDVMEEEAIGVPKQS